MDGFRFRLIAKLGWESEIGVRALNLPFPTNKKPMFLTTFLAHTGAFSGFSVILKRILGEIALILGFLKLKVFRLIFVHFFEEYP